MADVRLDDGQLRDIISKAIVDSLTPERREELIQNAVKSLLGQTTDRTYGTQTTVIQAAFNDAVRNVAVEIAREHLNSEEVRASIRALVANATARALTPNNKDYDPVVDKIADAVRKAITGDRY